MVVLVAGELLVQDGCGPLQQDDALLYDVDELRLVLFGIQEAAFGEADYLGVAGDVMH